MELLDSTCQAFNVCAARSSMSCDAHQILELVLAQRGHSTAPHSPVSSRRCISRKELKGFCFRMTIEKDAKLTDQLDAELAVQRDETISDQDFCDSDVQFHRLIVDACGNDVVRLALYTVIEALMPVTNMIIRRAR
jgi:DNA-binding FadR family transcriptional regulator